MFKIIHDTIYGSMRFEGVFLELLNSMELQRLHGIRQLGLAHLVFPGANHTRLEHSLGTFHVANRIAHALGLGEEEKKLVSIAAILHDIGHPPYSHTLEYVLHNKLGWGHMRVAREIIEGRFDVLGEGDKKLFGERKRIGDILKEYDIDLERVSALVTGDTRKTSTNIKRYLPEIIHGTIDADQIDYLLRDAHYTGVAHGTIDIDRLIQTIQVFGDGLVVHKRGVPAIEGLLVARALMYSSVYFHKTVRIAELMLAKAIEDLGEKDAREVYRMVDSELMTRLVEMGGFQREIVLMLKYRQLFKNAYSLDTGELSEEEINFLMELGDYKKRKEKEREICEKLGIPQKYLILDLPQKELLLSEPRINRIDIPILDNGKIDPLSKYSPLAQALQTRGVHQWVVMVSTLPKYRGVVGKKVEKILFE